MYIIWYNWYDIKIIYAGHDTHIICDRYYIWLIFLNRAKICLITQNSQTNNAYIFYHILVNKKAYVISAGRYECNLFRNTQPLHQNWGLCPKGKKQMFNLHYDGVAEPIWGNTANKW